MAMMQSMWLHHPTDPKVRSIGDQYLWGRDLLIAPVYKKGATSREVYLPAGKWYDWWTGKLETGGRSVQRAVDLATMPIYVRAGAIVPVDPIRQHTGQKVDEPTTLKIYRGANGNYTLYDDDGISLNYLQGDSVQTLVKWDDAAKTLSLEPASTRATLLVCDLALIPCGPSILDLRAAIDAVRAVKTVQGIRGGAPKGIFVPNKIQKNYRLSKELLATSESFGLELAPGLGLRQAFADSAGQKTVVWRMKGGATVAAGEMINLFKSVFRIYNEEEDGKKDGRAING